MNPLSVIITDLEKTAQRFALKAVINSCLARAIGSTRQHIRVLRRNERNEGLQMDEFTRPDKNLSQHLDTDLDMRNNADEDQRAGNTFPEGKDSEQPLTPIQNAEVCMSIYHWAADIATSISMSKYDDPNTVFGMLGIMVSGASRGMSEAMIDGLAAALEINKEIIMQTQEVRQRNDKEELIEQLFEIQEYLDGMKALDVENALDTSDAVLQHQLAVRVVRVLQQELDTKRPTSTITRIIQSGRLADLANITFIKSGIANVSAWVKHWEKLKRVELREAIDAGRNLNTLD
jgi:hypothetical protein